jgi:dephospho-CoA kinase
MVERIIAVSGMPGAGKSIVSNTAREMGYRVYSMGDIVREEANRLGLEPTPANLGMITLDLRKKQGASVVARMLIDRLKRDDAETVVVEGVRSIEEVEEFRKHFKTTILAVVASPKVRYSRLKARGRSDDPRNIDEFKERDERELGFGLSKVIDSANRRILNEADTKTFRLQIRNALEELSQVG